MDCMYPIFIRQNGFTPDVSENWDFFEEIDSSESHSTKSMSPASEHGEEFSMLLSIFFSFMSYSKLFFCFSSKFYFRRPCASPSPESNSPSDDNVVTHEHSNDEEIQGNAIDENHELFNAIERIAPLNASPILQMEYMYPIFIRQNGFTPDVSENWDFFRELGRIRD